MNGNSSYNWNNTSQWSQLSTNSNASQSTNPGQNTPQAPVAPQSTPETRRDAIVRLYKYILGREADNAGLNYYLSNYQISESEIAREMYESTEHQEVLQKAKDIRQIIQRLEESDKKMRDMQISLQKAEALVESYKSLLEQKAHMIQSLQDANPQNVTTDYDSQQMQNMDISDQGSQPTSGGDFLLDDPFAEDYEKKKGKGCIGKIKGLFKFN